MQRIDGRIVLSASDLNDFLACDYLTGLELDALEGALERPSEKSGQAELLARLGDEHERRYLEGLRSAGIDVVEIERSASANGDRLARMRGQAEATIAAMRAGAPAIYQATFFDGSWLGHADVLRRVEQPSSLGSWSYEVEDTKLARSLKPYFLVQLCFYSACVERVQGVAPEFAYVVLGDGTRKRFRVNEFAAYERFVRARLEERVLAGSAEGSAYPFHVSHCGLCVWDARCSAQRRRDDHLTGVAGLTRLQARRLQSAGIPTLAALGQAQPSDRPTIVKERTFERLSRQARLQLEQRIAMEEGELWPYRYELLPLPEEVEGPRGFALLPQPSPGDIFFDMEGDPFYDVADGLEYLFGAYTRDEGFRAFWGCDRSNGPWHDRSTERQAFEAFVDFAMARRAGDPGMHIYHYADYEKRALKSLAQRHATREDEVDTLLREERLVDLLRVVRQGVVVGQPGYGLKKMEAFYSPPRAGAIVAGDESVIEFERWRASRDAVATGERTEPDASILREIEAYNEQDCKSTSDLLDWLLARRTEAERDFHAAIPFFTGKTDRSEEQQSKPDPYASLKEEIVARLGGEAFDPSTATAADAHWQFWLALHLLDYHRREEKPQWWAFFDRCDTYKEDPDRLLEDGECIVELTSDGEPVKVDRSLEYPMTFPAQEIKVDGGQAFNPITQERTGTAVDIEVFGERGRLKLRRGAKATDAALPPAIIVFNHVSSTTLRAALARFSQAMLSGEIEVRYRAVYDLLLAQPPRFRSRPLGYDIQPDVPDAHALGALIDDLDDSYLFVQGPPGSGKTYQGAHAIVRLLALGLRVGVTANSHKAINNLLAEVERVAREQNVPFEGQRKHSDDDDAYVSPFGSGPIVNVKNGGFTLGDNGLYAGTAWAFADKAMDGQLDVLFIDEAGQVALPNALAAATSARRVVLLGDPAQLPHVRHTSHPGAIGVSVLEHLLGEELRPVARDRGVLLDRTWRMHPDVCTFISELMYEGRLHPVDGCADQRIDSPGLSGTGIRYIEVDQTDNRVRSREEAAVIADQIEMLLRGTVTDARRNVRPFEPHDVIVVTPYNAQRRCIEAELRSRGSGCENVRVGTVDKFQGQEAYVVFFSSAKSSHEESVRGVEFIFDRNRLNVAISRARALAVYVGSPAVLKAPATSIERMRSLSAGCALVEYGKKTTELSPLVLA
jgi:predicted RecB family nuclease